METNTKKTNFGQRRRAQLVVLSLGAILITAPGWAQLVPNLPSIPTSFNLPGVGQIQIPGSDIFDAINTYHQQLQALLQKAQDDIQKEIDQALQDVIGSLGLPDPQKIKDILRSKNTQNITNQKVAPDVMGNNLPTTRQQGQDAEFASVAQIKQVLISQQQEVTKQQRERFVATAQSATQNLSIASQVASDSGTLAQSAVSSGQNTQANASSSQQFAQTSSDQAQQAQAKVSTQEVLKTLAQQTATSAGILSDLSETASTTSSQMGIVSDQLAGLARQNSVLATIQTGILNVEIANALTSQRILEATTVNNWNSLEILKTQRGQVLSGTIRANSIVDGFTNQTSTFTLAK